MHPLPPLPDALRDSAARTLEALRDSAPLAPLWSAPGLVPALERVVALSPFADALVRARPDLLAALWTSGVLERPYAPGELARRCADTVAPAGDAPPGDAAGIKAALRVLRAREMLRIAWRELTGAATLDDTLEDLSALADACLAAALAHVHAALAARYGTVRDEHGAPVEMVVLALGKLGGRELNFSSDIDLIYAYRAPGRSDGARSLDAQEFFTRVGQGLTRLLDEATADGRVFRVDLRLRPFGSAGPLAADFDTLEHYYQEHGRDWERYALIKARAAAGDLAGGEQLLTELRPFVYRRYIDFGAIEALREMKAGIEAQVRREGLARDLKLGAGGIREVEFIGQVHQLIRGGREPALRARGIREVLDALVVLGLLPAAQAAQLQAAYAFLRRAENAVQMLHDRQTQALPDDPADRLRLACAMGFGADVDAFATALDTHRAAVHDQFSALLGSTRDRAAPLPWDSPADDPHAAAALAALGFADGAQALRVLGALRESHAYRTATATAHARVDAIIAPALAVIGAAREPLAVLTRFAALIEQICRRSAYVALLAENPAALEQLVRLMEASAFIATWLTRYPVLLDELLDPRTLYTPPSPEALRAQLDARLTPAVRNDLERAMDVLRETHHAQVLRIAAAELSAGVTASTHLAVLAQTLLETAVDLARAELQDRHGRPPGRVLVVGYGRLGSAEMGYESDLDLVFLHDAPAGAMSEGARALAAETFFARLAQRSVHILATNTAAGRAYEVDLRLRPSGQSGPLVSALDAFVAYQAENAWTWEHQALVRARPVAGDAALGTAFEAVRARVLARPRDAATLRAEIAAMRDRLHAAKDEADPAQHLKHAPGGLVDIEFLTQYLVLRDSAAHPDLTSPRDCAGIAAVAARVGVIAADLAHALTRAHEVLSAAQRWHALTGTLPDPAGIQGHQGAVQAAWRALIGPRV